MWHKLGGGEVLATLFGGCRWFAITFPCSKSDEHSHGRGQLTRCETLLNPASTRSSALLNAPSALGARGTQRTSATSRTRAEGQAPRPPSLPEPRPSGAQRARSGGRAALWRPRVAGGGAGRAGPGCSDSALWRGSEARMRCCQDGALRGKTPGFRSA